MPVENLAEDFDTGTKLPWEVKRVRKSDRSLLRFEGFNHYTGERFFWDLGPATFRNREFVAQRYDLAGADFDEGMEEMLTKLWPTWKRRCNCCAAHEDLGFELSECDCDHLACDEHRHGDGGDDDEIRICTECRDGITQRRNEDMGELRTFGGTDGSIPDDESIESEEPDEFY